MKHRFETFRVERIGRQQPELNFAWVKVKMTFTHENGDYYPAAEFDVAVAYGDDWTVRRIHEVAVEQVKDLLAAASETLANHTIDALHLATAQNGDD